MEYLKWLVESLFVTARMYKVAMIRATRGFFWMNLFGEELIILCNANNEKERNNWLLQISCNVIKIGWL